MVPVHSTLETRLRLLIEHFRETREKNRVLTDQVAEQAMHIRELKELCNSLRAQVDELGQDRLTLKRLKSERKVIRRNLDSAVKRLASLERELIP